MNRDDIIRTAREAGFTQGDLSVFPDLIVHFAALVAAAEREECARVCDAASGRNFTLIRSETTEDGKHKRGAKAAALMEAATTIRARLEKATKGTEERKKEWVGLTDEEIKDIVGRNDPDGIGRYTRELFRKIEAKLKEKNA